MDIKKIIGVLPAKNEEKFIDSSLRSIERQSMKPDFLLLIDDGSTDRTGDILKDFARRNKWSIYWRVNSVKPRNVGARVAKLLIISENILRRLVPEWSLYIKFDADTVYERRYIEKIVNAFNSDRKLGLSSGVTVNEPVGKSSVRGSGMAIRRIVWENIKLKPLLGWDSYMIFKTRMMGCRAYPIRDAKMIVLRPTSSSDKRGIAYGKLKQGVESGLLGYTAPFALKRAIEISLTNRNPGLFITYLTGYLYGTINYSGVVEDEIRHYVKIHQYTRLLSHLKIKTMFPS